MVDTDWIPLSSAAQRTGMSRQGVHRAASGPLCQLLLARQDATGSWAIAELAVEYYVEHRQWPKAVPAARAPTDKNQAAVTSETELLRTSDELRARVESAELGASLEVAAANAAQLAERDARIDALQETVANLETDLASVRAEYSSMLLARAASMTDRPR